jgi:spore germination protein KB
MTTEKIHNRQLVFMLFMIRSTVTIATLPVLTTGTAGQDAWLSAIISLAATLLTILLIGGLAVKFPEETVIEYSQRLLGKTGGTIICFFFLWIFLNTAATEVRIYAELLTIGFLPHTPLIFLVSSMVLLAAVAVSLGVEVIARTADALIFFYIFFIAASLLGALKAFEYTNVQPVLSRGLGPVISSALTPAALGNQNLLVLGILVPTLTTPRKAVASAVLAALLSGILLILSTVTVVGVLGPKIGSSTLFTFFLMTRAIEISRFVERIEALVVIAWGLGIFINLAVFLYCGARGVSQIAKIRDYRSLIGPMAVFWVILAVHTYDDLLDLVKFFNPRIFFPYSMTVTVLPYLLLWAAYLIRHAGRGGKKYIKKRRIKPG